MDNKNLARNCMNILDRIKYFESDISANVVRKSDTNLKSKSIKTSSKNKNTCNIDKLIIRSNNTEKNEKQDSLSVAGIKKQLFVQIKPAKYDQNVSKIPVRVLSRESSQQENCFTSKNGHKNQVKETLAKLTEKNTSLEVKKAGSNKTIDYDQQQTLINKNIYREDKNVDVRFQNEKDVEMWKKQLHFFESVQAMDEDDKSEADCNFADFLKGNDSISIENDNGEVTNAIFPGGEELSSQEGTNDYFANKLMHNNANDNEEFADVRSDNEDDVTPVDSFEESDLYYQSLGYDLTDVVYDRSFNVDVEENSGEEIVVEKIDRVIAQNRFLDDVQNITRTRLPSSVEKFT